jgi:hypothetical protein
MENRMENPTGALPPLFLLLLLSCWCASTASAAAIPPSLTSALSYAAAVRDCRLFCGLAISTR